MAEKRKTETKKPYQAKKRTKLAVETYDTVQQETHPKTDTDTDMMLVNADSKDKTSLMSFFKLKNEKTVSVEKEDKKTATSPPPKNTAAPVSVTKEKTPATTTASVDQEVDQEIEVAKAEEEESKIESKTLKEAAKTLAAIDSSSISDLVWDEGTPVPYAILCKTFELCENTTKRLAITEYLFNLFRQTIQHSKDDLIPVLYMCVNKLCPDYEGLELGIGESFLIKTIVNNTGRTTQNVKADYKRVGDLGTVALTSKSSQKTLAPIKPLMVRHVFEVLKEIASISGTQSQSKKSNKMTALFVQCKGTEAKYLIRQLQGKLRIGLAEQTVLSALAQAAVSVKPETAKLSAEQKEALLVNASIVVKSVYNQLPNYDMIVPALLKYSLEDFPAKCIMNPGIPLKPMLAHPTKSLTEVLDRFEGKSFTCEYKYDGERAQIHRLPNGETRVYSRNSENMSERYPDIMSKLHKWVAPDTTSFILDCEVVAWDTTTKKILPFQVLSTRKRKNVVEEDIKVQVVIFAFDCLYLNEKSLLKESLKARREVLCSSFQETDDEFYFATHMDSHNIDDIQTFLDQSIVENCEGLMVKTFDGAEATYEPSRRSRNWLKVKKDYLNGIGDSMDLVVIGAYYGRGKRTSVYGAFLLACVDSESEDEFETICKIGTGFSDEALLKFHNELKQHVTERLPRGYRVGDNSMAPDVWFHPVQVWEVLCADLSISPRYTAALGKVDESRGISLRFPRFIRVREDKNPEQATTNEEVMHFYESQASTSKAQGGSEFDY